MHRHCKLALAGIAAALFLSFTVTSASANRLSLSNQNFRITFAELKFFDVPVEPNLQTRCPVTLEGSFHERTFIKVVGELIGFVTRAIVNEANCSERRFATFLQTSLPWHVTYRGFSGTLPQITRIRVLFASIAYESRFPTIRCLFREREESISGEFIREAAGAITNFEFDHSTTIQFFRGEEPFCPPRAGLEGTGPVTLLGATTRITLTLI